MIFCLPKNIVDSFLGKLKSGEITPEKLTNMTSEERNQYLSGIVGATNASKVNALFESKLLLKNQQLGIINWAKQVSGIKPEIKRDLLSRVQKMDKILQPKDMDSFLGDLANQRLGFGVTMEEAGRIADLAKTVADKKAMISETMENGSPERIDYGVSLNAFKTFVEDLKLEASSKKLTEMNPADWYETLSGASKGFKASMDNSFFGRQGYKTLVERPDIWWDAFGKSWVDMGKELKGIDAINLIKADAWSRKNALNGKYKAIGLDIGLESEEAFPSSLPEKIPVVGRAYKASEAAYNGAALRMRIDLADAWIRDAEETGVDIRNKDEHIGTLINSITGRGSLGPMPASWSKGINASFFSIRFWKSTLDTMIAPFKAIPATVRTITDKPPEPGDWAKKKWAINTFKTIGSIAAVLTIAKIFDPESVELEPRSSRSGKIWVGNNHQIPVDITLGMGSLVTLASRLVPSTHKGKWGHWIKDSKGRWYNWDKGKYGKLVGKDLVYNYIAGKFAPLTSSVYAILSARDFTGGKPTVGSIIKNLTVPMSLENAIDLAQDSADVDVFWQLILNAINFIGLAGVNPRTKRRR